MNFDIVNIFPTTIYVGEMKRNHEYKCLFLDKIYDDYEFPHVNYRGGINTSSVNCGKPILHNDLFTGIHFASILENVLKKINKNKTSHENILTVSRRYSIS